MYKISPKSFITILSVAFFLSLPLAVLSNQSYLSGQLLSLASEKLGFSVVAETSAIEVVEVEESDKKNKIKIPTVITIPVPAEGEVPDDFIFPETELTSDMPVWGLGQPVVTGNSVKVNGYGLSEEAVIESSEEEISGA